jgi:hypothetical protein
MSWPRLHSPSRFSITMLGPYMRDEREIDVLPIGAKLFGEHSPQQVPINPIQTVAENFRFSESRRSINFEATGLELRLSDASVSFADGVNSGR